MFIEPARAPAKAQPAPEGLLYERWAWAPDEPGRTGCDCADCDCEESSPRDLAQARSVRWTFDRSATQHQLQSPFGGTESSGEARDDPPGTLLDDEPIQRESPGQVPLYVPCPFDARFEPPDIIGGCPIGDTAGECTPPCLWQDLYPCDVETLPVDEAADSFEWIWVVDDPSEPVDHELIDMVTMAWAFLIRNIDIVQWVACVVYGEDASSNSITEIIGDIFGIPGSVAECLGDKILGRQAQVRLEFTTAVDKFHGGTGFLSGGEIQVPTGTEGVVRLEYLEPFRDAASGADQLCYVADLAATLLHELVHTCVTSGRLDQPVWNEDDEVWDDDPEVCSTSYLIENSFRWALGQRYGCLANTACWYYACDDTWLNDGLSYPWNPPWGGEVESVGSCPPSGPTLPPGGGGGPPLPPPTLVDPIIHVDPTAAVMLDGIIITWSF